MPWRRIERRGKPDAPLLLLLLAEGRSYREIMAGALASPARILAVKKDWQAGGVARAPGTEERSLVVPYSLIFVVRWLLLKNAQRLRLLPHPLSRAPRWRCCCGSRGM